ncbi:acyltransferase family protein [Limnobacter sp.]|uniref:acyltransferase family protein n=1 Tax=Limnobacter sp. TaxID=2003368 RepID=UPI0039BD285B
MKDEQFRINTLRGLACMLLVAYHVIGSDQTNGLKIADGFYRTISDLLSYLRMPLFTFLSGIVYAYKPCQTNAVNFLQKKARRLLLPMLTVGTVFELLQQFISGDKPVVDSWFLLHIIPVAHYWFVESLFMVFILVTILEKVKFLNNYKTWAIVLFVSAMLYCMPITWPYFSFSGFIYLTPFFLAGMGVQRYNLITIPNRPLALVALLPMVALFALTYINILPMWEPRTLPALLIGFAACITLLALGLKSKLLARIGAFSYSIYLFHVFFTAFARILFGKLGMVHVEQIFIVSLTAGIVGPIIIEKILARFSLLGVLFLGKAPKKPHALQAPTPVHSNMA